MYCKNLRCIYNKDSGCAADEIHLDQYGKCADCVYPEQNRQNATENTTSMQSYAKPHPRICASFVNLPNEEMNPEIRRIMKKYKKVKK